MRPYRWHTIIGHIKTTMKKKKQIPITMAKIKANDNFDAVKNAESV